MELTRPASPTGRAPDCSRHVPRIPAIALPCPPPRLGPGGVARDRARRAADSGLAADPDRVRRRPAAGAPGRAGAGRRPDPGAAHVAPRPPSVHRPAAPPSQDRVPDPAPAAARAGGVRRRLATGAAAGADGHPPPLALRPRDAAAPVQAALTRPPLLGG